ncbi:MAG: SAM-dependent chlorinase/fluorinase [bacterium]|nr:SAM-dependent chlorinase/fluorinase [bacterium]
MKTPIITLTCDFGDQFAAGQIESVIYGINPRAKFILASKEVTPYSIIEGAFIIQKFVPFTLENSIHIGVVDPGVGSDRIGIIIKSKNHWFVGPNNGLLYPGANQDEIEKAYKIDEEKIGSLSNTFHGRDIFAKVAAYLSLSKPIVEYASEINRDQLILLQYSQNQVLHIDPYGNIKLNNNALYTTRDKLELKINEKSYIIPFVKTFAEVSVGEPLAYKGSHDTLEIAVNQINAAQHFGLKIEQQIQVQKVGEQQ